MKRLLQTFTGRPTNNSNGSSVLTAGAVISLLAFSSTDVRVEVTEFVLFFF